MLVDLLCRLDDQGNWHDILALDPQVRVMTGSPADRARALHFLGRAYWNLGNLQLNPWHVNQSVRCAKLALKLDPLEGLALKTLGSRLVTIGQFREGRQLLNQWLVVYAHTNPVHLAGVQYTMGYAARYERNLQQAQAWYSQARETFRAAGYDEWACLTNCALVQVLARMEQPATARALLSEIPVTGSHYAYRLKCEVELLAAEGRDTEALHIGEMASSALLDLDDPDAWELIELHTLLAQLQFRTGNLVERDKHMAIVNDALRTSPRHDLYTAASLLLDHDRKEEIA